MPFTAAELEEMRRADEEIEREFRVTPEDLRRSREQDRQAELDALPTAERIKREYRRAYYAANRDKVLEYRRAYYEANREKVLEYQRAYREANREKVLEGQRAYREANRDKVLEYRRAYYEANREKVLEYQRAYREANREKVLEGQRAYREANREKVLEGQRWMRDERVARGYTQRELAALVGVSQPAIARLETGSMRLDAFAAADRLREILGAGASRLAKENPRQEAT